MYLSEPLIYGVLLVFWGCWKKYHQVGGLKMEIYFFTVLEATIQNLRLWWGTLVTWCEELTHWKRPWFWEWLKVGGEGDNRGWDGWMASPTQWTWVCVSSRSWWWTGKPGILQSMGLQRVGHDWAAELNWNFLFLILHFFLISSIYVYLFFNSFHLFAVFHQLFPCVE